MLRQRTAQFYIQRWEWALLRTTKLGPDRKSVPIAHLHIDRFDIQCSELA